MSQNPILPRVFPLTFFGRADKRYVYPGPGLSDLYEPGHVSPQGSETTFASPVG